MTVAVSGSLSTSARCSKGCWVARQCLVLPHRPLGPCLLVLRPHLKCPCGSQCLSVSLDCSLVEQWSSFLADAQGLLPTREDSIDEPWSCGWFSKRSLRFLGSSSGYRAREMDIKTCPFLSSSFVVWCEDHKQRRLEKEQKGMQRNTTSSFVSSHAQ